MKIVIGIRSWLQKNKVFFDVFAALMISGASLVVSYSTLRVSEKTLAVTEVATLPHFALSKKGRVDAASGKAVEETLVLNNHGSPAYNISWDVRTFLMFEDYIQGQTSTYIPVNGYYFAQFPTSAQTGEISSIVGHNNLRNFSLLYEEALKTAIEDKPRSRFPSLVVVSVITYEDRLGRCSSIYFRGHKKVEEMEVHDLLELAKRAPGVDIETITLKEALELAKGPDSLTIGKPKQ
jgi:hypothetical protein